MVYNLFQLSSKYLGYYINAANGKGHGVHSPFIFHFIRDVLNDKKEYPEYFKVEELRKRLLNDDTIVTIEDFGAGTSTREGNERTVSSIARKAAKPKKYGQLLFRMIRAYRPDQVFELGTSLGITSSYLSLGNPNGKVTTLEGAPAVAIKASENFMSLGLQNVSLQQGNFDQTLSAVLEETPAIDFAFIDGNHRKEPTERYFQQILSKVNNESILVFDDIHWSREMEGAWQNLKLHPSVTCSVDLFFIGILFFRKEFLEKQHFTIRF
jgi:predicted O-methyltransferase YrrM